MWYDKKSNIKPRDNIINKIPRGMMMLMGTATCAMISFPVCIISPAEKLSKEQVRVNQVPLNTPVMSIKRINDKN